MKTRHLTLLAVIGSLGFAGAAQAGSVVIDAVGGPVMLKSGDLSGLLAGADPHTFSPDENRDVLQALQADGISTNGMISFLLADTSDGLSFITLIDDDTVGGDPGPANLVGMSSTAPSSTDYWINDYGVDILDVSDPFGITTTASGTFEWFENRGDAFAWSNLQDGDGVTFSFEDIETAALNEEDPFQFVTWDGDEWQVVETADWTENGQFAFSFVTIVPVPAPLLLGVAGLAGL
ncbi:MAG: hypothetical protein SYC29_07130, partial [Planctomycetota bacterium]|nr:hypothetical protein [Planctomycetota bacterium]